jgi:hypothetical protein
MASENWETLKTQYCIHAAKDVSFEAEMIYPSESLPDQPPRVIGHRCSEALVCNLQHPEASCVWAGTNPEYDPFKERA